ncbi:cytochrome P450 CYP12A2-like [Teleopsis dalmanni]|uniref:cytochrome P450 CYP12A2-like n=1 Tax=Teleopsis dalmanni TaxID=139649 RepID=UPI0018CC8A25|nr:cytochrome P450 CYP12A2-like [Teleopsis dalmanni]
MMMRSLKLFNSFMRKDRNALNSFQSLITNRCYCVAAINPLTWEHAKPLKNIPTVGTYEFIVGNLPWGKFYKKDFADIVRLLHEEKGDIFLWKGIFGQNDLVFTQTPDDFENIFRHDGIWPERKFLELATYHRNVYRKDYFGDVTGLLASEGKAWGDLRTLINPILVHPKNTKIYLPSLSKINQEFIDKVRKIRNPETLEVPADFADEIKRWTLESVGMVALDKELGLINGHNPEAMAFVDSTQLFFDLTVELEFKPSLWRYLPNKKFNEAMQILDNVIVFATKYINEAIERFEKSPTDKPEIEKSVLEKLLKIDKKVAIITAVEMFTAGVDTTSTALMGLLLCLAKNPEKQEKLRQEILSVLPEKNSELTVENMKNLPYLRACIKESLRVYPLAVANVRQTAEDLVLSGFQIPKGSNVNMTSINLIKDSKYFSQPNEFIPERWLRNENKDDTCPHNSATKSNNPFIYLPFGFGPRSCIGRRIAEMELEIAIARLVRNFGIEFNYPTENAFKCLQLYLPVIPMKFKFTDLN